MKKCKTCGAEFTDDTPVCPICGSELEYMTSENAVNTDENAVNTDENAAVTNLEGSITNETEQPAKKKKSKAGLVIVIIILLAALGVGGFYLYKYLTKSPFEILAEKLSQLEDANSYTMDIDGSLTTGGVDVPLSGALLMEKNDKTLDAQVDVSAEIPMLGAVDISTAYSSDLKEETAKCAMSVFGQIQAYSIDLTANDWVVFDKLENAKTLDEAVDAIIDIIFENADDEELEKLNKEELKACIKESLAYLNSKEALKEIWHYEKKDDVYSFNANTLDIFNVFVENMKPAFKDAKDYESFVADFKEAKAEYEAPFKMSFIVKSGNLTSLSFSSKDKEGSEVNLLFTVKDNLPAKISFSANIKEDEEETKISLDMTCSDFNKTKVEFSDEMLEAFENAEELKPDDILNFGPNSDDNGDDDNGDNDTTDNTGTGEQTSDYELIARTACEKHLNDYGKFASEAYVAIYGYEEDWIIYKIESERPVLVDDEQKKQDIIDKLFGESFDTNDMWTKSEGYANGNTAYWCVIENDKTCTTAFNDIADTYDALSANGITLNDGTVFVWKSGSKKRIFKLSEGGGIIIIANSLEDETTADLEKVDTSDIEGASSKVKVYVVK